MLEVLPRSGFFVVPVHGDGGTIFHGFIRFFLIARVVKIVSGPLKFIVNELNRFLIDVLNGFDMALESVTWCALFSKVAFFL